MTITSRVSLKAALSDGQTLTGDNLANLIDSYLHLTDTSAQSVASDVTFTGSCTFTNLNLDDIDTSSINFAHMAGGSISVSAINITTNLSAATTYINNLIVASSVSAAAANFSGIVSAGTTYIATAHALQVQTHKIEVGQVNVSAVSAGSVNAGIIGVSAVSAGGVWTNSARITNLHFQLTSSTTVATGTGSATPASVAGFIKVDFDGAEVFLPYYTGS